jgi:multimeric flavodoxin WrbA
VAQQIAEKLSCDTEEIRSKKNRHGFGGILTCVIDQILNRYDDIQPLTKEINPFNPVIIASPIWIQKISSPVRTFIKDTELLKGKDVYIVLTFNGHLTREKEQELKSWVKSQGINLKGLVNIVTKKKDEKDLKKDAESIIEIL